MENDLPLDEINRLRALEKAATPGPLKSHDFVEFAPGGHFRLPRVETENGLGIASAHDVGDVNETNANAALFASLRNAAPALLDMVAKCLRLRRESNLLRLMRCQYTHPHLRGKEATAAGLSYGGHCRKRITHATVLADWQDEILAGCEEHIVGLCHSSSVCARGLTLEKLESIRLEAPDA